MCLYSGSVRFTTCTCVSGFHRQEQVGGDSATRGWSGERGRGGGGGHRHAIYYAAVVASIVVPNAFFSHPWLHFFFVYVCKWPRWIGMGYADYNFNFRYEYSRNPSTSSAVSSNMDRFFWLLWLHLMLGTFHSFQLQSRALGSHQKFHP